MSKHGYTLTEFLITLGIIGVVSAITIPIINSKINDMIFANQKKKAYSEFMQAFEQAKINNELIDNVDALASLRNFRELEKYFKVIKSCDVARDEGCWIDVCDKNTRVGCYATSATNPNQASGAGFIDISGRHWAQYRISPALFILVDVNGNKLPNTLGKDRFPIELCENKEGACIYNGKLNYARANYL